MKTTSDDLQPTLLPVLDVATRSGNYTLAHRTDLLRLVCTTETRLREAGAPKPYCTLISGPELSEIQAIWRATYRGKAPSVSGVRAEVRRSTV